MSKPVVLLDPHWRQMRELFSDADRARLSDMCEVVWGQDTPCPPEVIARTLPETAFLIACTPQVGAAELARAPKLRAVIEVSGAFPATVDYPACKAREVEVLCCAPGFRNAVAEMTLAMLLSGARGLVTEHEAFREGGEHWLADRPETDFTVYGATIGFVGLGSIARETLRLLAPFGARVLAHDPWCPPAVAAGLGVTLASLSDVMAQSRAVIVAAAPSAENRGLIGAPEIAAMPAGGLLVVVSRAHLVDFPAAVRAAEEGRIRLATDVFPDEPLPADHPVRQAPGVILSPHRAAAVTGGRQLIGRLIVDDIAGMLEGQAPSNLQRAANVNVELLAGVGDAAQVGRMATKR